MKRRIIDYSADLWSSIPIYFRLNQSDTPLDLTETVTDEVVGFPSSSHVPDSWSIQVGYKWSYE